MAADPRFHSQICDLLGCSVPILQAGMGGPARSELAAAVAEAGGFGMLGMVRESPELIGAEIDAVRARTNRPFAVNLIPSATQAALLDAELGVAIDRGVPAFCFFWDVVPEAVTRAKRSGALVLHQVGTVDAAKAALDAGVDVLIAQGVEAGGHVHGQTGALVLVEQVARMSTVPVVASGGFATGASLVAAMALGAQGIHCGTAFLATEESFAHDYHKDRLIAADAADTVYTDAYVLNWPKGAPVRVIRNSMIDSLGFQLTGYDPAHIVREQIAQQDGSPILRFSTDSPLRNTVGDLEAMALYAGQGTAFVSRKEKAADVIDRIMAEAGEALDRMTGMAARKREMWP
ncbi:MAG: nitronate monooxygenase [Paracoccaceae bacterium]